MRPSLIKRALILRALILRGPPSQVLRRAPQDEVGVLRSRLRMRTEFVAAGVSCVTVRVRWPPEQAPDDEGDEQDVDRAVVDEQALWSERAHHPGGDGRADDRSD